jgi:hypothetical protein
LIRSATLSRVIQADDADQTVASNPRAQGQNKRIMKKANRRIVSVGIATLVVIPLLSQKTFLAAKTAQLLSH